VIERAEAATEGQQRVVVQMLVAEQQHKVVDPGAMDDGEVVVIDMAQVNAPQLGAQRGTGGDDRNAGAD
jgi:hypothetical protein